LKKFGGGQKIKNLLDKDFAPLQNCGEAWEISGVKNHVSQVKEGYLAGKFLDELIHIYKEELVGTKVYHEYGNEFPILIKFIDANEDLSVQVHPNDELAMKRHNSRGKTEMWYIVQADTGAKLNSGFNQDINREIFLEKLNNGKLLDILNFEEVKGGDVFFLPAGRIHFIGKGIFLAEIQQTSDITYRIYDFDRVDSTTGKKRELHTEMALDALNFKKEENYKTTYNQNINTQNQLVKCNYFQTNLILLDNYALKIINPKMESFRIYIGIEGSAEIICDSKKYTIKAGDAYLMPAVFENFEICSKHKSKILETYI